MSRHKHSAGFPVMLVVMAGLSVCFAGRDTARAVDAGDNLLVWLGNGAAPGSHTAENPGQLALMDADGNVVRTLMDIPPFATRVIPCGSAATSPDGEHFAFFVGTDSGSLYLMSGAAAPALVNDGIPASTCVGGDMLAYSDGSQIMYLTMTRHLDRRVLCRSLHIANTRSGEDLKSFIGVVTFDVNNQLVVRALSSTAAAKLTRLEFSVERRNRNGSRHPYPTETAALPARVLNPQPEPPRPADGAPLPGGRPAHDLAVLHGRCLGSQRHAQMSGVPAGGFRPCPTNN
jgi:hypothetical protein